MLTLRDVEMRADLRVRLAVEQALTGAVPVAEAVRRIDAATTTLTALLSDPGLTSAAHAGPPDLDTLADAPGADLDRLWVLGMAYQRRAHVSAGGREQALTATAACIRAALAVPTRPPDRPRAGVVAQLVRAELALCWTRSASRPIDGRPAPQPASPPKSPP